MEKLDSGGQNWCTSLLYIIEQNELNYAGLKSIYNKIGDPLKNLSWNIKFGWKIKLDGLKCDNKRC